jgi:hypothetical protein
MNTYHEFELLASENQRQRLQEAEYYRLIKQAARRQRSQIGLQHLPVGLVALFIRVGVTAALLTLTIS